MQLPLKGNQKRIFDAMSMSPDSFLTNEDIASTAKLGKNQVGSAIADIRAKINSLNLPFEFESVQASELSEQPKGLHGLTKLHRLKTREAYDGEAGFLKDHPTGHIRDFFDDLRFERPVNKRKKYGKHFLRAMKPALEKYLKLYGDFAEIIQDSDGQYKLIYKLAPGQVRFVELFEGHQHTNNPETEVLGSMQIADFQMQLTWYLAKKFGKKPRCQDAILLVRDQNTLRKIVFDGIGGTENPLHALRVAREEFTRFQDDKLVKIEDAVKKIKERLKLDRIQTGTAFVAEDSHFEDARRVRVERYSMGDCTARRLDQAGTHDLTTIDTLAAQNYRNALPVKTEMEVQDHLAQNQNLVDIDTLLSHLSEVDSPMPMRTYQINSAPDGNKGIGFLATDGTEYILTAEFEHLARQICFEPERFIRALACYFSVNYYVDEGELAQLQQFLLNIINPSRTVKNDDKGLLAYWFSSVE